MSASTNRFTGRGGLGVRNTTQRERAPMQNLLVRIDEIHLVNAKTKQPVNWTKDLHEKSKTSETPVYDYMMVTALHDAPEQGIVAGNSYKLATPTLLDRDGKPTAANTRRRDIAGLAKTKSGGPAMGVGSVVSLEKAYISYDMLHAQYTGGHATKVEQDEGVKIPFPAMATSVMPEKASKKGKPYQTVLVFDTHGPDVTAVTSAEDIVAAFARHDNENTRSVGHPGILLVARKLAAEDATEEAKKAVADDYLNRQVAHFVNYDKPVEGSDQYEPVSPEAAVEAMLAAPSSKEVASVLGDPEWQVEFVPMLAVNQANSRLMATQAASGDDKKATDHSSDYTVYEADENGEMKAAAVGVVTSNVVIAHVKGDDGSFGPPFSSYQKPVSTNVQPNHLADIQTSGMPDYHRVAVVADAARLLENTKAFFRARKAEKEATADASPRP